MKTRPLATILLFVVLLNAGGCAISSGTGDEYQRIDGAVQTLTLTVGTINDLAEAGVIPPEKLREVLPYAKAAREALARAEAAYEAGSRDTINSNYRAAMNAATGAIEVLVRAKADGLKTKAAVERVKAKPATVPGG